jgi:hypothetical protein
MTIKVGTWVTYDDEDPKDPSGVGQVVEPTGQEIRRGASYEHPRGPEHGHVLVEWDDDLLSRSWQKVGALQIIAPPVVDREARS